ncbi:hydrolase 76 protein [Phlyctochytrium bullatum]|nr:hydrolase 76 protein [Phlyctochytrium bullatum]
MTPSSIKNMLIAGALLLASPLSVVQAATTLDVKSSAAISEAARLASVWLGVHYDSWGDGAWNQNIIQWHESGMYWQCYLLYRKVFSDTRWDSFIASEFVKASYNEQGDFLNGNAGIQNTLHGKWNDDIAWWGLATLTGAETYGRDALVNARGVVGEQGRSWFFIANTTFYQMLQQWDTSTCNGGIYWSRDRASKSKDYKSSITNGQAIEMAARLYRLQPSPAYKKVADDVYAWMKKYVIQSDYTVIDGFDAQGPGETAEQCATNITPNRWSYQHGVLIPGMALWYNLTKEQRYLDEAQKLFEASYANFVDENRIIHDPICRMTEQTVCTKTPGGFTWALFRGLAEFYTITPNATARALIEGAIEATALDNAKNCPGTNANWNCIRTLNPIPSMYTLPNGTNPRDQIETMEILTTLGIVRGFKPLENKAAAPPPTTGPGSNANPATPTKATATATPKSAAASFGAHAASSIAAVLGALGLLALA